VATSGKLKPHSLHHHHQGELRSKFNTSQTSFSIVDLLDSLDFYERDFLAVGVFLFFVHFLLPN